MLMLHTNELNYISFILMRKLLILIVVFFSYFNTVLAEVSYQEILKDPEMSNSARNGRKIRRK